MANETGDMKILGNFRRMIDLIVPDTLYQPSNGAIAVENLEARLAAAIAAVEDIAVKMAPNKFAINARQDIYAETMALVRGSRNILKASGVSAQTLADADTFSRKVLGLRKSKKTPDDPNTASNEAVKNHSASQQSFDAVLGNFRSYIEILKGDPIYAPSETQYKTGSLEAKADEIESKNNAVSSSFVPLSGARSVRDDLLYTGAECLCNLAQMVKAYVKAVHGPNSSLYRAINALSFKRTVR